MPDDSYGLIVSFANYFPTMPEERAFVLGVEWGMIDAALKRGDHGPHVVRVENVPLLDRLATSQKLMMEVAECDPVTEGWQLVRFGGTSSGGQPKYHDRDARPEAHAT